MHKNILNKSFEKKNFVCPRFGGRGFFCPTLGCATVDNRHHVQESVTSGLAVKASDW